jgi:hypothetical protein
MKKCDIIGDKNRRGVILLITLIVLVVLASLGYTLTTRIASQLHRDQYIIDYQNARYACDSGLKYMLTSLEGVTVNPIDRPNEPDFSDVFGMTDEEYKRFLADWAAEHLPKDYEQDQQSDDVNDVNDINDVNTPTTLKTMDSSKPVGDSNELALADIFSRLGDMNDSNTADSYDDPNNKVVPGPYGPQWPLAAEPIELEVGNAKVTVEIEDENAKLPLIWGANTDKEKQREVDAAIGTFGEWMNMSFEQIDNLRSDLKKLGEAKPYKAGVSVFAASTGVAAAAGGSSEPNAVRQNLSRRGRRARTQQQSQQQMAAKQAETGGPMSDFVRLLHSSMVNTEPFAQPYIKTQQRTESILKYMSRWGATQVNVNSAPRQVLESAFMFGGDAEKVADAIIKERQLKPFKDANDLQKRIYKYADSIRKSQNFITTKSDVFSVKITAVSGVATATTTAAVMMEGKKPKVIAIITE